MSELWRPMSTAPRDGRHFLGRISVNGIPSNVAQVYWDTITKGWKNGYCPTCGMFCTDFVDTRTDVVGWIPLPGEAPIAALSGDGEQTHG